MTIRTGTQAVEVAREQSKNGPQYGEGECLWRVHDLYGVPNKYGNASEAWANAKFKHLETDPTKIPFGVPVWWTGGSHGFGHVAVAGIDAFCWSTDIRRIGYFDRVPITEIHDRWGLTLVGWSEDINDVRVYTPPPPAPPKEPVVPISTPHIDNAIAELGIAIAARKSGPVRYALRTSRRAALLARRLAKGA